MNPKLMKSIILPISIIFITTTRAVLGEPESPPYFLKSTNGEIIFRVEIEEQQPFEIPCEAAGNPTPKYFWTKNGQLFSWTTQDDRISQMPGKGTLLIHRPEDSDTGQYQCFAENDRGIAASNTVFVRKFKLGSFKAEAPALKQVIEGRPFHLTCQGPDGWPRPNLYWLKEWDSSDGLLTKPINDPRITIDPKGTLWFSNTTLNDTHANLTYTCAAASYFKDKVNTGNRVKLEVIPRNSSSEQNSIAPVIQYTSPKFEIAISDQILNLYCIFGGTPLPTITWYKDGKPIQFTGNISSNNNGKILNINQVAPTDEGNYTCQASNGIGDPISHTINLKILEKPTFTTKPKSVTISEDETVEFHCKAAGNPIPNIIWTHNGKPISEAPVNLRRKVSFNSIIIEKVLRQDTGNYGCNATNSLGYVYEDVYVNVLAEPPLITQVSPANEETVEASTIVLKCHATGRPKPRITWIRKGAQVTGNRFHTAENGDLTISKISFADMGSYTCSAQNKIASANTIINLLVRRRTLILPGLGPSDTTVKAGESAIFKCSFEGDPSLDTQISWLRNGIPINFTSEPRFYQANDNSLRITTTNKMDNGKYTCVASTRLDEAKAEATLTVQDASKN